MVSSTCEGIYYQLSDKCAISEVIPSLVDLEKQLNDPETVTFFKERVYHLLLETVYQTGYKQDVVEILDFLLRNNITAAAAYYTGVQILIKLLHKYETDEQIYQKCGQILRNTRESQDDQHYISNVFQSELNVPILRAVLGDTAVHDTALQLCQPHRNQSSLDAIMKLLRDMNNANMINDMEPVRTEIINALTGRERPFSGRMCGTGNTNHRIRKASVFFKTLPKICTLADEFNVDVTTNDFDEIIHSMMALCDKLFPPQMLRYIPQEHLIDANGIMDTLIGLAQCHATQRYLLNNTVLEEWVQKKEGCDPTKSKTFRALLQKLEGGIDRIDGLRFHDLVFV
jgi:hypothetical protein